MHHEALSVEEDANPLCLTVHYRVSNLKKGIKRKSATRTGQRALTTMFFMMRWLLRSLNTPLTVKLWKLCVAMYFCALVRSISTWAGSTRHARLRSMSVWSSVGASALSAQNGWLAMGEGVEGVRDVACSVRTR